MRYRKWQQKLDESEGKHLSLLAIIMLGIQILSVVRNPAVIGANPPMWLLVLDFLLLTFTGGITAWTWGKNVSASLAHPLAAALYIMAGISAILSIAAQKDPLPFYFAMVLLAGSLCFLSQRYLLSSMAAIMLLWLPVAILFLTPPQIYTTLSVSAVGVVLSLFIMRRRITGMINVFMLERRVVALESILPMCASCKKTRDETGKWQSVEAYIEDNQSGTQVSHGSCPSCTEKLYGDLLKNRSVAIEVA